MTLGTITVGVGQTTDQAPPPPPPPPSELASFLNQIMPVLLILMLVPLVLEDFPKAKEQ